MGSIEIDFQRTKDKVLFRERIPIGGGADYLSMPGSRAPGRMAEVVNMHMGQVGGYTGRYPYAEINTANRLQVGGANARITQVIDYQRKHDSRQMMIVVADNNLTGVDYKCAVFWVRSNGEFDNLVPDPYYYTGTDTGQDGLKRDLFWDWTVFTNPRTLRDMLCLTNGSTVPLKYDVSSPSAGSAGTLEEMGYVIGPGAPPVGEAGDWYRPDVSAVDVGINSAGLLNGRVFYKATWVSRKQTDDIQQYSPASAVFPPTSEYAENGITCDNESVKLGAASGDHVLPNDANAHLVIWRTKGGGFTFYLNKVLDPGTTEYVDNIPDDELTDRLDNVGDPPEAGWRFIRSWGGRLWFFGRRVWDGSTALETGEEMAKLAYSDFGKPESVRRDYADFRLIRTLSTRHNDGATGLHAAENYLLATTEDSTWALSGWDPGGYGGFNIRCVARNIGNSSHRSFVEDHKARTYWFYQKRLVRFDGYAVEPIAPQADGLLGHTKLAKMDLVCAAPDLKHQNLYFAFPTTANNWNDSLLVFNYQTGEICTYKNFYAGAMAEVETASDFERIYFGDGRTDADNYGLIYRCDQITANYCDRADATQPIEKYIKTDRLDQGFPGILKEYEKVFLVMRAMPNANDESYADVEAWVNSKLSTAHVVKKPPLKLTGDTHDYVHVGVNLRASGAALRGHWIELKIGHNDAEGIPFEIVAIELYGSLTSLFRKISTNVS